MQKKQVSRERRSKELREQVIQDFLEHPEMLSNPEASDTSHREEE